MKAATVLSLGFVAMLAIACDRDRGADDPSGYGQPTGYDQYGNPVYGQPTQPGQPGYGQPQYPQPGQPGQPGYGPAPPAPTATQSQPAAFALPCQNDVTCGTHKCNLTVGRCVFPCQNAQTDCAAGLSCVAGGCVPGLQ